MGLTLLYATTHLLTAGGTLGGTSGSSSIQFTFSCKSRGITRSTLRGTQDVITITAYSVHFQAFLSDRFVIKIFEIFEIPDKLSEQGCRDVRMPPSAVRDIRVMLHTQSHLNLSIVNSTICKCKYEARSTFELNFSEPFLARSMQCGRVCWIFCSRGSQRSSREH